MLKFINNDAELIMIYTPAYGVDEVLKFTVPDTSDFEVKKSDTSYI